MTAALTGCVMRLLALAGLACAFVPVLVATCLLLVALPFACAAIAAGAVAWLVIDATVNLWAAGTTRAREVERRRTDAPVRIRLIQGHGRR